MFVEIQPKTGLVLRRSSKFVEAMLDVAMISAGEGPDQKNPEIVPARMGPLAVVAADAAIVLVSIQHSVCSRRRTSLE